MKDLFDSIASHLEVVGAVIAAILTILAGLSSGFVRRADKRIPPEPDNSEASHVQTRVQEARNALERQGSIERRNQWAGTLLTFGQYIIGAVLASSFVQESLSKPIVGSLGVLVLLSSSIHQRYRPDLKVRAAKERRVRLSALIRISEDELAAVNSGRQDVPSVAQIILRISQGLADIESSEIRDFEAIEREGKVSPGTKATNSPPAG